MKKNFFKDTWIGIKRGFNIPLLPGYINRRIFHSPTKLNDWDHSVIPLVTYNNIEDQKTLILENNKGKTGIYRWINMTNSKCYVGSAIDLRTRFWVYFSKTRLMDSKMPIYKAIIKYGYVNFKLQILEYCELKDLLVKEQYYINHLKPEYNILSVAGNSSGYKHTESTMAKFKLRMASDKTRANLAEAASGRILSKEAKTKISMARTGTILSNETKTKLSNIGAEIKGVPVKITNIVTGEVKQYSTLTLAGIDLGVSRTAVKKAVVSGKAIKKIYLVKLNKEK